MWAFVFFQNFLRKFVLILATKFEAISLLETKARMPEVELLEVFGSDLTVVNAARVSMGKESTVMTPGDAKLIKYLATHKHVSPFFHPQIRFRLRMPIPIARE
jgi:hypothetical protein